MILKWKMPLGSSYYWVSWIVLQTSRSTCMSDFVCWQAVGLIQYTISAQVSCHPDISDETGVKQLVNTVITIAI